MLNSTVRFIGMRSQTNLCKRGGGNRPALMRDLLLPLHCFTFHQARHVETDHISYAKGFSCVLYSRSNYRGRLPMVLS